MCEGICVTRQVMLTGKSAARKSAKDKEYEAWNK